jgi:alpha-N-arabinofuranosidase
MFANHVGDKIVPVTVEDMPKMKLGKGGESDQVFYSVTRDSKNGNVYLKLVNGGKNAQPVTFALDGVKTVKGKAEKWQLSSAQTTDTNSMDEPTKIVPVASKAAVGKNFTVTLDPSSIVVLTLQTK